MIIPTSSTTKHEIYPQTKRLLWVFFVCLFHFGFFFHSFKTFKKHFLEILMDSPCTQLCWTCPCSPVLQRCWASARRPTLHPAAFLSDSTSSRDGRPTTPLQTDQSSLLWIKYQVTRAFSHCTASEKQKLIYSPHHPPLLKY